MTSRQDKEWEVAVNKKLDSLKHHQAFDKVPIKTALPNKKVNRLSFRVETEGYRPVQVAASHASIQA